MITSNKRKKPVYESDEKEVNKLREKLESFDAQTDLGRSLLEISKKGLESGVSVLDADEIIDELGRSRYE